MAVSPNHAAARAGDPCAGTLACIVTFEPLGDWLAGIVRDLRCVPGLQIALIDNSTRPQGRALAQGAAREFGLKLLANSANRGVAGAHNQALEMARAQGFERLLLLDQDSRLPAAAVHALHTALEALLARGEPVAAVGARQIDRRTGDHAPFVRLGPRLRLVAVDLAGDAPVDCDLIISSGCLIPLAAAARVGPMDETLFIDYVDIEWCARARAQGMKVFGVPAATMEHAIGERILEVAGRRLPVHVPHRSYYLVRNALLFARKPYLGTAWRLHLIKRALLHAVVFPLFCAPRWPRFRWVLLGLLHGSLGTGGPCRRLRAGRRHGSPVDAGAAQRGQ